MGYFSKKKNSYNYYDEEYERMTTIVSEAKKQLLGVIRKVIIRKEVISLYPEGPDQEQAIKDYEDAKHSLLCAIGNYDGRLNELKQYFVQHREEITQPALRFASSHEIIEIGYEQFVKG